MPIFIGIPSTGLRFFTVYGPWGRPDMAAFIFTRAIIAGEPIKVFNHGEMWRDFTYIDDIVDGVVRALDRPASGTPPHKVYNLGNHKSEKLTDYIAAIEQALQRKAIIQLEPMQPGDVQSTYADIEASRRDLGFEPTTPISVGMPKFVDWYKELLSRLTIRLRYSAFAQIADESSPPALRREPATVASVISALSGAS